MGHISANRTVISCQFSNETAAKLRDLAKREGVRLSDLIRRAIDERYIEPVKLDAIDEAAVRAALGIGNKATLEHLNLNRKRTANEVAQAGFDKYGPLINVTATKRQAKQPPLKKA